MDEYFKEKYLAIRYNQMRFDNTLYENFLIKFTEESTYPININTPFRATKTIQKNELEL